MSSIKQLRFRIINGIDIVGKISYSRIFDLMDAADYERLRIMCMENIIRGFAIDTSLTENNTDKIVQNKFEPLIEYLAAEDKGDYFLFMDKQFPKMSYHIIGESILDINEDAKLLINAIVPGNIDKTLSIINEMFGSKKEEKQFKINHLFKKIYKY